MQFICADKCTCIRNQFLTISTLILPNRKCYKKIADRIGEIILALDSNVNDLMSYRGDRHDF